MYDKLTKIIEAYEALEAKLGDPAVMADMKEYTKLTKEHANQRELVEHARQYVSLSDQLANAKDVLKNESDPDFKELAQEEIAEIEPQLPALEEEIKFMLLPADPNDEKDIIVEIRSAAGGDEAAIFAGDLFKMYSRYAESKKWKIEVIDSNPSDQGGFSKIEFKMLGDKVYSSMKFESGVHRVQRVPKTESQGRIQTSTATVAVLPEADDIEIDIKQEDLRIDVYRAGGPGGQCVNTTQSAVRLTHLPTGIVVSCQDEKSQLRNKEKAMKILRARIYEVMQQEQQGDISSKRKSMVGSGERSERIRTFNFPQGRVTDHRIGLTLHRLDSILEGNIDEIIDALIRDDQMRLLKEGADE